MLALLAVLAAEVFGIRLGFDLEAQGVELVHSKEKISQSQGQGESTDIYWHFLDLCLDSLVAVLLFLLLLESFTLMFAYCLKSK